MSRWRRGACVLVAAVATLAAPFGVAAAGAQADPARVELLQTPGSITFTVPDDAALTLGSGRRLGGLVRLHPVDGGVLVVADVATEEYVAGIAEMPARWDLEALKAQAVAARTYAWWQLEQRTYERRGLPYDICASTACQVFDGRRVIETALVGARWQEAVAATAGEALLVDGQPILARYHSTSGGRTRDNALVYPSSGDRTYLRGVEDPFSEVSPLHAWSVGFDRERFDELLAQGQSLSAASPMAQVRITPAVDGFPAEVTVVGRDGTEVTVGAVAFRRFVSDTAASRWPQDYPSQRADGARRLPITLPSSRYAITVTEAEVRIDGAGWGHGVGMSQYGAWGRARAGQGHAEILAAYYAGAELSVDEALPSRIRVGLGTVDALELTGDVAMQVSADGEAVTVRGFGTWRVVNEAGRLRLLAPGGYGAPLITTPTTTTRSTVSTLGLVRLAARANKPVDARLEVRDDAGTVVLDRALGTVLDGVLDATWDLDGPDGVALPVGSYDVRLVALDEVDALDGTSTRVTVTLPQLGGPGPSLFAGQAPATSLPVAPVAAIGALAGALLGGLAGGRRRTA